MSKIELKIPGQTIETRQTFADWLLKELFYAYMEARKGKCRSEDEYKFEINLMENLVLLRDEIMARNYMPSRGIAFIIFDPVMREIFAAPFRDRVVHHFLDNMTGDWFRRRFSQDSYSCQLNKGTLYGVERMAYHMRAVSQNCEKEAVVAKFDIRGFFMSINRFKLSEMITDGLNRQFTSSNEQAVHDLTKYLWDQVIFDDPTKDVTIRGSKKDWEGLPPDKSLFCQPPNQGLVIGNVTSQLASNIYLDPFDRFLKYELGYEHSGRYVDDFYIVVLKEDLPKLMKDVEIIRERLAFEFGLTLHPNKIYIQDIRKGCPFLGTLTRPFSAAPGKRFRANYYDSAIKVAEGRKGIDSVISYLGHAKHLDADLVNRKIFEFLGWRYNG